MRSIWFQWLLLAAGSTGLFQASWPRKFHFHSLIDLSPCFKGAVSRLLLWMHLGKFLFNSRTGFRVSSASWYFLNIFGLRSMYGLVLGSDNAADNSMILPDHQVPTPQAPQDMQKAFKAEWEALEVVDHHWALADCETRLLNRLSWCVQFFFKCQYTLFFESLFGKK